MHDVTSENIYEIRMKIREEADLYSPLDPDQEAFSDDVIAYLERKYNERANFRDKPVIHIISEKTVNAERVNRNFKAYMRKETELLTKEQKRASLRQARLFVIGILFIAVWLVFALNTDNIFVEVLSIIGSFSVWEAADIWIVEKPGIRIRKRMIKGLSETEIRFSVSKK